MDDSLEAKLAADEAAIRDDGFSARVTRQARHRSRFRRTWLAGAGLLGGAAATMSIGWASPAVEEAFANAAPAQFVLSLPVVDLTFQLNGATFLGVALALVMLVGVAAARFASDDI